MGFCRDLLRKLAHRLAVGLRLSRLIWQCGSEWVFWEGCARMGFCRVPV